jgi:hypothetical protein
VISVGCRIGSFSTEAANSAVRPTSAFPQKPTSDPNVKLVAKGQLQTFRRVSRLKDRQNPSLAAGCNRYSTVWTTKGETTITTGWK